MYKIYNGESVDDVDAQLRNINDNLKKYNKSLENIYDDAEIEAEIEAEKKIKSNIIEIHNRPNYLKYFKY